MSYAPRSLSYLDGKAQATMDILVDLTQVMLEFQDSEDPKKTNRVPGLRKAIEIIEEKIRNAN